MQKFEHAVQNLQLVFYKKTLHYYETTVKPLLQYTMSQKMCLMTKLQHKVQKKTLTKYCKIPCKGVSCSVFFHCNNSYCCKTSTVGCFFLHFVCNECKENLSSVQGKATSTSWLLKYCNHLRKVILKQLVKVLKTPLRFVFY